MAPWRPIAWFAQTHRTNSSWAPACLNAQLLPKRKTPTRSPTTMWSWLRPSAQLIAPSVNIRMRTLARASNATRIARLVIVQLSLRASLAIPLSISSTGCASRIAPSHITKTTSLTIFVIRKRSRSSWRSKSSVSGLSTVYPKIRLYIWKQTSIIRAVAT